MNKLKDRLLSDWDMMRVFRLVIGAWLSGQALVTGEIFAALAGAFFLYQAIMGISCCGVQSCYAPPRKSELTKTVDIDYEEVK